MAPPPLQRPLFHRSRFPRRTLFLVVALVTALSAAFFFHRNPSTFQSIRFFILDATAVTLETISDPFEKARAGLKDFQEIWKLKDTLRDIRAQRDSLLTTKDQLQSIRVENQRLRSLLTALPDPTLFQVTSRLIARHEGPFTHQFLVLAGTNNGIEKNQAVMAIGGLVGRTYDVGKNSSTVMTLYDSRSEIPIRIERTRERGILKGHGNPELEVLYLNKETSTPVKVGDRLVTSGDGRLFPPNLFVGKVVRVGAAGKIWAQSVIDWSSLEFVRITHKSPPS
ncbi:MAG: rod shape-determining protein MreC [bacterium]|nr:rod shape-determining protein MreC [bacterium]